MFIVIETKAGFAVQNSKTYVIVTVCDSRSSAEAVAAKLNK
jgi:hypothetical protein